MELEFAYRSTTIGTFPKEWDVVPFSRLLAFRNGVNADKGAYGRGVPFINVLEVITCSHLHELQIPGRVWLPARVLDLYAVRHGDVLFNRTSETQKEVGLSSVYLGDDKVVFGGFVIRGRPIADSVDVAYSGYGFRAPAVRRQIVAKGQGAIRANIGQADLREVLVPLPPLSEQRAIATALGDADALIVSLGKLISKKRDIKRSATHQLLAGRRRLPGFVSKGAGYKQTKAGVIPADWEARPLLSTVHIAKGQVDPKAAPYRSMILVAPDHIESGTGRLLERRTAEAQGAISGKYLFEPGDIVYSKIRPYLRKAILANFSGLCSADMYPLTPARDVSSAFIFEVFLGQQFSKFTDLVSVRSGIPKINREELAQFAVPLPPRSEQEAIAEVLSDMDAEIAALEARRSKTLALKQAMMQELLTGRTRLV